MDIRVSHQCKFQQKLRARIVIPEIEIENGLGRFSICSYCYLFAVGTIYNCPVVAMVVSFCKMFATQNLVSNFYDIFSKIVLTIR